MFGWVRRAWLSGMSNIKENAINPFCNFPVALGRRLHVNRTNRCSVDVYGSKVTGVTTCPCHGDTRRAYLTC